MRVAWLALAGGVALGCARAAGAPGGDPPACTYFLTPPPEGSWSVAVEARFERAPSARLVAPEAADAVRDVTVVDGDGAHAAVQQGGAWLVDGCRDRCTVRYRVDLAALAASCHRMDCARRVGDAVIGSAAVWMLRPDPLGDALLRVRAEGNASRFITGLRRDPSGGYVLRGHELGEAAYTAFGSFRRARVDAAGTRLDVALLGPPLAMGDEGALRWVQAASSCVAGLFGRFPVTATVFVVPVPRADEVVFGRVMSMAGASVTLLFGAETPPAAMHDDWVVVHELFHLGTPTFVGEGHWLEEGLATYYEPILRERAGWTSEADLWKHFVKEMPRGLRKDGEPPGLEDRDDIDSTYWGGALFALMADVDVLGESRGERSLDDVLRAVLEREGDATRTARVADFVRLGDEATGTRALSAAYARYAVQGQPVDLDALWRALGVVVGEGGAVTLRDDAPLASLRRAIAAGAPH